MRLRALSISTTSTVIVSPRVSTSSTCRPVAAAELGDMEQPVGALLELDEGAEVVVLTTLPVMMSPTSMSLVIEVMARLTASPASCRERRCRSCRRPRCRSARRTRLAEALDRLAALADDHADLIGVDLDREDARRMYCDSSAPRLGDHGEHLVEDEQAAAAGLLEGAAQDLEAHARDLDVHLQGGDAVARAGDLEVHVAEVVFDAGDVGQHDVVVALLDQTHGDARPRAP
jgi:hypothetical protein